MSSRSSFGYLLSLLQNPAVPRIREELALKMEGINPTPTKSSVGRGLSPPAIVELCKRLFSKGLLSTSTPWRDPMPAKIGPGQPHVAAPFDDLVRQNPPFRVHSEHAGTELARPEVVP